MAESKMGQDRNADFECLEPSDLGSVPVAIQALDNQWMPRKLLRKIKKKGRLTTSIEKERESYVRAEYMRALVNGRQAVINRAYIYNNQAVFQDYLQEGESREAFKALLQEGVIVPYLYTEQSPFEPAAYENAPRGFETWQKLSREEVSMQCVRLSWDDELNSQLTRDQLARRFHNFAQLAAAGDFDAYLQDLGLDLSAKSGLRRRLIEIAQLCLDFVDQEKLMTRNVLYKAFVTAGDNPQERMYDVTKSFALEIKPLIDLAYNSYLPDALGGYLLTPVDSLPRTALQEWQQAARQSEITGEDLVKLVRRSRFDLAMRELSLKSMGLLSLQDVREVRKTDEWRMYIGSLEDLLQNPFEFADGGIAKVYESYAKLARQMTHLVEQQDGTGKLLASWAPIIELVINIAGAVLSILWTREGKVYQFSGQVSTQVAIVAAPVVARLVIRNLASIQNHADLTTSIDFMKYKIQYPHKQWAEMQLQMKKLPGFQELRASFEKSKLIDATINYQEQAL